MSLFNVFSKSRRADAQTRRHAMRPASASACLHVLTRGGANADADASAPAHATRLRARKVVVGGEVRSHLQEEHMMQDLVFSLQGPCCRAVFRD